MFYVMKIQWIQEDLFFSKISNKINSQYHLYSYNSETYIKCQY